MTEGVAEVIVKDVHSGIGKGLTSEVPLAFQTAARAPTDPASRNRTRKALVVFALLGAAGLAVLWLMV
ncbi:hypothetical protein AX760_04375 [Pararhizobium antarcticum]|uniref:Uncharacterized protein n=2 Tax=Pararhizobium antarcticum TaxID=1798805 RepID=A0A657LQI2_9HYPH|nr:hypothetical protein AX760_04375 [Pararhizobium antarcticum]OJF98111.1 hypothetical protein AX761_12915 [Rhizobium sp. 58]